MTAIEEFRAAKVALIEANEKLTTAINELETARTNLEKSKRDYDASLKKLAEAAPEDILTEAKQIAEAATS